MKKFQNQNWTQASNRTSIGKNNQFQRFEWMTFLPNNFWTGKNRSLSVSKNRDEKNLNVSLTLPKTRRRSEKLWFSQLTSDETIVELRFQLNISHITQRVQIHSAKEINGSLTTFKSESLETSKKKQNDQIKPTDS